MKDLGAGFDKYSAKEWSEAGKRGRERDEYNKKHSEKKEHEVHGGESISHKFSKGNKKINEEKKEKMAKSFKSGLKFGERYEISGKEAKEHFKK